MVLHCYLPLTIISLVALFVRNPGQEMCCFLREIITIPLSWLIGCVESEVVKLNSSGYSCTKFEWFMHSTDETYHASSKGL